MNTLSKSLGDLSQSAKKLEDKSTAAEKQMDQDFQQWARSAEEKVDAKRSAFSDRINTLSDNTKTYWGQVKTDYNRGVETGKEKFNEFKKEIKEDKADIYADIAEEDAETSVLFAIQAIAEAEVAVTEAFDARKKAEALKE